MNVDLEDAIVSARSLRRRLERVYEARERKLEVPAARLKLLERLIEECSTHPAFADMDNFRKGYKL
jgi:hypothetical protein